MPLSKGMSFIKSTGLFLLFVVPILWPKPSIANDEQIYWGAPYEVDFGFGWIDGPFSSVQEAVEHATEEMRYSMPASECVRFVDNNDPYSSSNTSVVAQVRFEDNGDKYCHESYWEASISASRYTRDSIRKNLGDPCCNAVGNPVNASTGNKYQTEVDFSINEELQMVRYYNSSELRMDARLGYAWRHNYERHLDYLSGHRADGSFVESVRAIRRDGKIILFIRDHDRWLAETGIQDRLVDVKGDDGKILKWVYFDANDHIEEDYDGNGLLQSINYQDGRKTTLTYKPSQLGDSMVLVSVRDSAGRALSFAYGNLGRVDSVTLPDGGSIKYKYDNGRCDYSTGRLASVTYQDGSVRRYEYVSDTRCRAGYGDAYLTGIVDESGSKFASFEYETEDDAPSWQYDSFGSRRVILSKHGVDAEKHQFAYLTDGSVRVTYPEGIDATLSFVNRKGNLLLSSVSKDCNPSCGQTAKNRFYDDNGYPTSLTDFNGNVRTKNIDSRGLLTRQVDAAGSESERTILFTWDDALRMPLSRIVSNKDGRVLEQTAWTYNHRGQVLARCEVDPDNSAASAYSCLNAGVVPSGVSRWTYTYCTSVDSTQCPIVGLMLTTTGPRTDSTQATTYSYYMSGSAANCGTPGSACYQAGDLRTITDAAGHVTTIASYDGAGRITRLTDANGINTDLTYTPRGWLASRSINGQATTFTYTPYGAVQTVTDPDGVSTTYGYDTAHRLVKITDAHGNYVQYTLDAAGNKTAEQVYDSSGMLHKSLTRTFNTLGQLTKVMDGLSHTVFDASVSGNYDANGNLVQSIDGLGIQRQLGYDALNRLVQTLDNYNGADSATKNTTTQYTYDSLDRLTQLTDPSNLATSYSYDGLSNATGQQSPDTGATSRTFDAAGNMLTRTDAKGITATYTYDVLNRPITVSYPDRTQNITYTYDETNSVTGCSSSYPIGRLTRIIENAVTTMYCYDAEGRVTSKRQSFVDTVDPELPILPVRPPHFGNCRPGMVCISESVPADTTYYRYTAAGRLSSIAYSSGTQVSYARDSNGRIRSIMVTPPSETVGTVVSNVTYQPFGPIASYTLGNGQTIARSYDANYRLTDLTSPAFSLHVARDVMGHITAIGNAVSATPVTETYGYDPLYHLTAVNNTNGVPLESGTYNATGDRLSKTGSGLATGNYNYNANTHQLIATGNAARSVDANGNTTAISQAGGAYGFGYNDRNRLVVAQLAGGTVGNYLYNALNQRIQKTANGQASRFDYNEASQLISEYGSTNRDYIWLGDIPVANVDISGSTSTIAYVIADQLGTPRAVTDSSGTLLWQWAYQGNSFGEQVPQSSGYLYNLRYPGQYYDVESGLHYNVNRYYDPTVARYTQADPLGFAGGQANLYAYVGGNPLSNVDPSGLANVLLGGNVGLIAVGGFTLGGGVYVGYDSNSGFDIGVYGSVGGGIGVDLGAGVGVGYVPGSSDNISGQTVDINAGGGPISGTFSASTSDGTPSGFIGVSAGLPATGALTTTETGHFGYQDVKKFIQKHFGSKPSVDSTCH